MENLKQDIDKKFWYLTNRNYLRAYESSPEHKLYRTKRIYLQKLIKKLAESPRLTYESFELIEKIYLLSRELEDLKKLKKLKREELKQHLKEKNKRI